MRQRITFIQEPQDSVNPKTIEITKKDTVSSLSAKNVIAAREDRITFGFEELPQELYRLLKGSHESHVRWVTDREYVTLGPMVSRMSPGLHVFWTGQRNSSDSELLCPVLKKVFGDIDCSSPKASFTRLPTERFSQSAAWQYYSPLPSIKLGLIDYLDNTLCRKNKSAECLGRTSQLETAASFDVDYDTISHALTLTAFWPPFDWDIDLLNLSPKERMEVGILSVAPAQEPEELSLGGFLTVIGEDTKPSPTLFSFPSRHHALPQYFTSTFNTPTGLHPTLKLSIDASEPPFPSDERSCSLHTHLTLPRHIFPDKYQFSDPLFLASKNLSKLHYTSPNIDLEAPSYTLSTWGSSVLFELAPPAISKPFTAEIPLHLRYLPPSENSSSTQIEIPYSIIFWACTSDEGTKFPINPFDRINLGYDGLFGPRTMFYHLNPRAVESEKGKGELVMGIEVPVLGLGSVGSSWLETGTAGVVVLGFLWIIWCLWRVWRRDGYGRAKKLGAGKKTE